MSKLYHSPVDVNAGRILPVETGAVRCRRLTCCIVLKTMRKSCTITRRMIEKCTRQSLDEPGEGSNYFMIKYASRRSNLCSVTRIEYGRKFLRHEEETFRT